MDDLISRQAAIDAILHITNCKSVRELFEYNQEHHLTEMWSGGVNDAIDAAIGVESATDTNVATKLSTNLASLGTDCISRQAAIDALDEIEAEVANGYGYQYAKWREYFVELPSAQPEIIRCAECKWFQCNMRQDGYLPKGVDEFECRHWCGYCDPTDFCSYAERRTDG